MYVKIEGKIAVIPKWLYEECIKEGFTGIQEITQQEYVNETNKLKPSGIDEFRDIINEIIK